jgi:DNA gyrase subunit A
MEVVEPDGFLALLTTRGFGKRTLLSEYPPKGRASGGVQTIAKGATAKVGPISAGRVVQEADDLIMISSNGVVLRTSVNDIPKSGRATRGVRLMSLQGEDSLASLARVADADLPRTDEQQKES